MGETDNPLKLLIAEFRDSIRRLPIGRSGAGRRAAQRRISRQPPVRRPLSAVDSDAGGCYHPHNDERPTDVCLFLYEQNHGRDHAPASFALRKGSNETEYSKTRPKKPRLFFWRAPGGYGILPAANAFHRRSQDIFS
jgi:hypothetical protein